jgi:hypothetical protein
MYFLIILIFMLAFIACSKSTSSSGGSVYASMASSSSSSSSSSTDSTNSNTNRSGVLTAAEWNDLENWSFLQNLLSSDTFKTYQSKWGFYCGNKWIFTVSDITAKPVEDAVIKINDGNEDVVVLHTNRFGIAHAVPAIFSNTAATKYTYSINYKGKEYATGTLLNTTNTINYTLAQNTSISQNVDLMFVVDATGSMGDELEYLKNELYNVLSRADSALTNKSVKYGLVFYRDNGDDYVTRPKNFTPDKNEITNFVKAQSAGGGGDTPEAVDQALTVALQQSWSSDAHARIMFLILDAPPHDEKMTAVRTKIKEAAQQGITIIPLAASGTDKSTEFLLRFIAIATNGTYTFLTDDSGIGNAHTTPSVGTYKVEFLNNLMVRLISKYAGN